MSESIKRAAALADQLLSGSTVEQNALLREILERIELRPACLRLVVSRRGFALKVGAGLPEESLDETSVVAFDTAVQLKRRGVETKLVLGNGAHGATALDEALIDAVSKGHVWLEQLRTGQVRSVRELAKKLACDRSDVGRMLRLAFLAPDIVEAIFSGRQPVTCAVSRLRRLAKLPLDWAEQRKILGFDA